MKEVILIPAYEPNKKFIKLLSELKGENLDTIVVDDGSGENYKEIFDEAKKYAQVLTHDINLGKGHALKTGLKYIKEKYKDNYLVVTMDCDGQHTIKDAKKLIEYIKQNDEDLVLGKRLRSDKTPIRSRIGNGITKLIYFMLTGLNVYDTQTGLRCFSYKLVPFMLSISGERFEYEMNVLLMSSKRRIKIKEIQIKTIYIDNNSHSHFKVLRDAWMIYKEIIKFSISSIMSFVIDYSMYVLLLILSKNIVVSNIFARIISATFNYNFNKRIVFKDKEKTSISLSKYILLAITIIIFNTLILNVFVNIFLINKYFAKIITEIILFILSYFVQSKLIFNEKEEKNE